MKGCHNYGLANRLTKCLFLYYLVVVGQGFFAEVNFFAPLEEGLRFLHRVRAENQWRIL